MARLATVAADGLKLAVTGADGDYLLQRRKVFYC